MIEAVQNDERELIRAVVADPDSDTPRLVYAKWLLEHGQSDRGRLIEAQCQLNQLQEETRAILDRHAAEWGRPLAALGANRWEFHRGFPESIHMTAHDVIQHHERLNALTPVRHLQLGATHDDSLKVLAQLPFVAQLRSLEIGDPSNYPSPVQIGLGGIRALVDSMQLRDLERLAIHSHNIGAAGAKVIAHSGTFANLTHLTLDDPILKEGHRSKATGDAIVGSPALVRLKELQLGDDVIEQWMLRQWRNNIKTGLGGGQSP